MKLIITILLVAAVATAIWFFSGSVNLAGDGAYKESQSIMSPNGTYAAEAYVYQGGATVRSFSFVSIRSASDSKDPDDLARRVVLVQGNVSFEIAWSGNDALTIRYGKGEVSQQKDSVGGIKITFEEKDS